MIWHETMKHCDN